MTDALRADLGTLASTRVFFAHHSVGRNVLDGLTALGREAAVPLTITSGQGPSIPPGPAILEAPAGQNGQPDSKFSDFAAAFPRLAEHPPAVGAVKLCFVDFTPATDVEALFGRYRSLVTDLQTRFPAVALVHVTVPLTVQPRGLKDAAKRLLGRGVWEDDANARRREYNDRLRAAFAGQPIFDLAAVESARPDGTTESFTARDGRSTPALFPGYSDDGSHLNAVGARRAAAAFAHAVATAAVSAREHR